MERTEIGNRIRTYRKNKGLTQIELAQESKVAVNSIRLYETGKRTPRIDQLKRIADALDMPVKKFFDDKCMPESDVGCGTQPQELDVRLAPVIRDKAKRMPRIPAEIGGTRYSMPSKVFPTGPDSAILCMIWPDGTLHVIPDYPMPLAPDAPDGRKCTLLEKEASTMRKMLRASTYKESPVCVFRPEIGAGILEMLENLSAKAEAQPEDGQEAN